MNDPGNASRSSHATSTIRSTSTHANRPSAFSTAARLSAASCGRLSLSNTPSWNDCAPMLTAVTPMPASASSRSGVPWLGSTSTARSPDTGILAITSASSSG